MQCDRRWAAGIWSAFCLSAFRLSTNFRVISVRRINFVLIRPVSSCLFTYLSCIRNYIEHSAITGTIRELKYTEKWKQTRESFQAWSVMGESRKKRVIIEHHFMCMELMKNLHNNMPNGWNRETKSIKASSTCWKRVIIQTAITCKSNFLEN